MTKRTAKDCLATLSAGDTRRRKAHLTFRGNTQRGRHGWLRLTPAYSLQVVEEILANVGPDEVVLDPFSGTATTTLASVARGIRADSVDVNPFLVWLGNLKLRQFPLQTGSVLVDAADRIARRLRRRETSDRRWRPNLHQIEKWWNAPTLDALSALSVAISEAPAGDVADLLKIAFCKVMISTSNASFGHQSMSFRKTRQSGARQTALFSEPPIDRVDEVLNLFSQRTSEVAEAVVSDVPLAEGRVVVGDSRELDQFLPGNRYTVVITSPPYPNRMSYIRELRPYMYWLGYLTSGRQAGEMDWRAIGGTWGCATSNLNSWSPQNGDIAYPQFSRLVQAVSRQHRVLGNYVHRYFDDIKVHLHSLRKVLSHGARCFYVVGNSKFYDTVIPVEQIYAALFEDAGFTNTGWKVIRKRNSKKELFEYVVHAEAH